jgi:hypothetical protein
MYCGINIRTIHYIPAAKPVFSVSSLFKNYFFPCLRSGNIRRGFRIFELVLNFDRNQLLSFVLSNNAVLNDRISLTHRAIAALPSASNARKILYRPLK